MIVYLSSYSIRLALLVSLMIPIAAQAWQETRSNPVEISIIDSRGWQFPQYPLREAGASTIYRAYLEAKRGESYEILARNRSRERIGIVIAVDGRNIISGKPSQLAPDERMYVLEPGQQAIYQGWRTGRDQVNRFYFTDAEDSYAGAWGDYTAMGVISAAVYAEATPYHRPWQPHRYKDDKKDRSTQQKRSFPGGPEFFAQPGTGFGEEEWSPARRVEFRPEREPVARYAYKYEWRETLCRRGIAHCPWPERRSWENRDEYGSRKRRDDYGYTPYPPGYRWNRR